jgi:hypothetical protein
VRESACRIPQLALSLSLSLSAMQIYFVVVCHRRPSLFSKESCGCVYFDSDAAEGCVSIKGACVHDLQCG